MNGHRKRDGRYAGAISERFPECFAIRLLGNVIVHGRGAARAYQEVFIPRRPGAFFEYRPAARFTRERFRKEGFPIAAALAFVWIDFAISPHRG